MPCGRSSRPPPPAATPIACARAEARPSGVGEFLLAHHREDVVARDRLAVLVADGGVPAHLTVPGAGAQGLLLAGEAHANLVTGLHRLAEAQGIDAIVGEHRPDGR